MRDAWVETTLGEIAHVNPEKTPRWDPDHAIRYLDIASVSWGQPLPADIVSQPFGEAPGRARRRIRAGDIVVSTVRPNLRAMGVVPEHLDGEVASTGFTVLRARDGVSLPGFLWALVSHQAFTDSMVQKATGSNYPAIRATDVASYRLNLPPLEEQRRIVDLIGASDNTIAAARVTLEQALSVLNHFPASLVARGRAEGWTEKPLGDVLGSPQAIRTGPFGSQLHKSDYLDDGPVAVVMPADMKNGRVLMNNAAKISQEDADRLARHITREGDILWSRRGDVTRFAMIDAESAGSLCGTGCFLLRPSDPADAKWLEVLLSAPETGQWLMDRAVGATMANLNRSILGAIPVLLPPGDEGNQIVASWAGLRTMEQQLFKVADHLHVLRSNVLTVLLSGEHEIPESYDAVMGELVETGILSAHLLREDGR